MSENKGRNDANSGNLLMQKLSLADSCFSSERILSRAKFGSTRNLSYPILFTCCMSIMPFTARTTDMLPSISGRQAAFLPANRLATFSDDQASAFLEILLQNLIPSKESSWLVALTSIAIKLEQSKFFWIHMHHIGRLKLDSIRESHLVILVMTKISSASASALGQVTRTWPEDFWWQKLATRKRFHIHGSWQAPWWRPWKLSTS